MNDTTRQAKRPPNRKAYFARKRAVVTVAGGAVIAGGVTMIVPPGPGIIVIAAGIAILADEYVWAAQARDTTKTAAAKTRRRIKKHLQRTPK